LQQIRGRPAFNLRAFKPNTMRFFLPKERKIENFGILRQIFPMPNPDQRWLTQPEQQKFDPT